MSQAVQIFEPKQQESFEQILARKVREGLARKERSKECKKGSQPVASIFDCA